MRVVSGIKPEEAETVIHSLLALLEKVQKEHERTGLSLPPQQLFFSIYDLQTLQPKAEYQVACEKAVKLMREAGVPLSASLNLD